MNSSAKLALASVALMSAAAFSGCSTQSPNEYSHELYKKNNEGFNAMGIVDWSPNSYQEVSDTAVLVANTDEITKAKNITGDNLSLFWGTFVLADY